MKNELTRSEINRLISACMICSNRYKQVYNESENKELVSFYPDEAKKYEILEYKLRQLCYDENKKLIAVR